MAGLSYVTTLSPDLAARLESALRDAGFEFRDVDHARFAAKGENVNVVCYTSGKLVVQGKGLDDFRVFRLNDVAGLPEARLKEATIGCDEAGKGDYFGPLVVAACALTPEEERFLDEVPLQDSKTLTDAQVRRGAEHLRQVLKHEIISIGPRRYNEMYESFQNVNKLLAWAHAKAMLAVVDKTGCRRVILDQFADRKVVERALGARSRELELLVHPRAEADPAVAAASILARDGFLRGLARLTDVAGMPLPKGAGAPVLKAGRALVGTRGASILKEVAKFHFKTTGDVS